MSSSLAWECSRCTYIHTVPGTRCVMCDQLRVTKEQMRDFVMGKTLPKRKSAEETKEVTSVKENRPPPSVSAPKPALAPPIRNPYAKIVTVVTGPTKPPPSNGTQSSFFNQSSGSSTGTAAASSSTAPAPVAMQTSFFNQSSDSSTGIGAALRSTAPAPVARQSPSHSTWSMSGSANGNNEAGNRSVPSMAATTAQTGPAHHSLPITRPASAVAEPPQPRGSQSNNIVGNNRNGVGNMALPKQPAPSIQQQQKNPFTMSVRPTPALYTPGPVPLCPETASDWIYPIHQAYPMRDYQLEISQAAIMYNTLVSLPTGLGKTLIASVVLYNFYRWFPTGKVIFLAPTLPLVNQQVKACYDIMGIPAEDTALLTGKVAAKDREGLWKERRVFFCTPQTVQRDIESGRCPAKQVVCVVLDEAHKASGAYAYVKVVQYLEEAGAKFRVLGLSATPGTGIKAIQEVITALRIQKVEARLEDDASVKKYIHERHNEIIIVKQSSAITTIERLLHNVIAPLLERLRGQNGMSILRCGNATLTPYCIIRAKQDYHARTNDHSLDGLYHAVHTLIQIRAETRRTGIGMVRTKMIQLRNEARGILSSVVRGKEFQTLMDAVLRASSDPNNINERSEDRKLNNPKLMKLDEILVEHFERARACEKSSRAIVFTQWRDSVSEIVAVLAARQPLLRARHFVGQGKSTGGTNKDRVDQTCVSLKGMKQKEQQEVIREFREGAYNILVCTCIGEEGLDIGEVDLIVNYDSLRSPIRMIQRVGRTGRKRDGRVVCLVSEGAEEKTMVQSKNAERTLGRALKKPDSFTVIRGSPMFPQAPVLQKVDMTEMKVFHMSQVGGNVAAKRSRDVTNMEDVGNEVNATWRLKDTQELKRQSTFGDLSFFSCLELQSSDGRLPQALGKRLLRARTRSISTYENRYKPVPAAFGISRAILLEVERKHGKDVDRRVLFNNASSGRLRRESGSLQQLFPLERSSATDSLDRGILKMSLSADESSTELQDEALLASKPSNPVTSPLPQSKNECNQNITCMMPAPSSDIEMTGIAGPQDPYVAPTSGDDSHGRSKGLPQLLEDDAARENIPEAQPVNKGPTDCVQECPSVNSEFRLPTPPESSYSEGSSDDDDDDISVAGKARDVRSVPQSEMSPRTAADSERDLDVSNEDKTRQNLPVPPVQLDNTREDCTFRLPTQESSSDDESSDEDSDEEQESPSKSSNDVFVPPREINVDHAAVHSENSKLTARPHEDKEDTFASQESKGRKLFALQEDGPSFVEEVKIVASETFKDTSNTNAVSEQRPPLSRLPCNTLDLSSKVAAIPLSAKGSSNDAELINTPHVAPTPVPEPRTFDESGAELTDTPQFQLSGRMLPPPIRTSSHDSQAASKDDAEDIVCSICFDGASTENNPIVLCDGPNNDLSCPLAVHKLCYSIEGSLDDVDHWHCDACAFRQQRRSTKRSVMQCFVCQKDDGPLKQMQDSSSQSWFHPHCRHAVVDEDAFCQYCALTGGTCCAYEGCNEYAHPHCGLQLNEPWIVVSYASSSEPSSSSLGLNDVTGCNIYCPPHRVEVCRSLTEIGVISSSTPTSPGYVIVSSKLRDLNRGTAAKGTGQRKRLRKKSNLDRKEGRSKGFEAAKRSDDAIESVHLHEQKRQRIAQRMKERAEGMQRCRFLDLEVDIDSDDADGDLDEEDEARRIEEEEAFYDEFINDSSQLGRLTQDELDRLGLGEHAESQDWSGAIHRQVDVMRERMHQFATPIFNRRMRKHGRGRIDDFTRASTAQGWDEPTPASEPSSQKGFGNMHFVRSVLEHCRNGGAAEDIEEMYNMVARESSPLAEDPAGMVATRPLILPNASSSESESSDTSDDENSQGSYRRPAVARASGNDLASRAVSAAQQPANVGASNRLPGELTEEQKKMIEKKRQEALRRRQQFMVQNNMS